MAGSSSQPTFPPGVPALAPTGQCRNQPVLLLDRACLVVGAQPGCDVFLVGPGVAPIHALIVRDPGGVYLRNLAGPADVLVNGQPILEHRLAGGEEIHFGQFTFQFRAEHVRFAEPAAPPAAGLQGNQILELKSRTVLIGRRPGCDIHLEDPSASESHAVLFSAGGQWFIRDLDSLAGTFVNDARVRQAKLNGGDRLRLAAIEVRFIGGEPSLAPEPMVGMQAASLGGMPMELPPVTPPRGFGQIGITFEGKSLHPRREAPAPPAVPPQLSEEENQADAAGAAEADARTPVLRKFPPVPRIRPLSRGKGEDGVAADAEFSGTEQFADPNPVMGVEVSIAGPATFYSSVVSPPLPAGDGFNQSEEHVGNFNDAVFGGQPLGGTDHYVVSDAADYSDSHVMEIEDFSENQFWDKTDDEQLEVPLPAREKDLSPPIPPLAGGLTTLGMAADAGELAVEYAEDDAGETPPYPDDIFGLSTASGADSALGRAAGGLPDRAGFFPSAAPPVNGKAVARYPLSGAKRTGRTVGVLMGLMLPCMAAAAGGILWFIPNHATVEGRLVFLNTPPESAPAWQSFSADQRNRLADPAVAQNAARILHADHPEVAGGFLQPGSAELATIVKSAQFDNSNPGQSDLVFHVAGNDGAGDSQRLSSLLRAIYAKDSDLTDAAAAARQKLADWQPNIDSKQRELDDSNRRIEEQQKIITAAAGLGGHLGELRDAVDQASKTYAAAEQNVLGEQAKLDELQSRLSARASTGPATRPVFDTALDTLGEEEREASDRVAGLRATVGNDSPDKAKAAWIAAQQKLAQDASAVADVEQDNADFRAAVQTSTALLGRVDDLTNQLAARRADSQERFQKLQRFIEQSDRRRQEIIDDADPQLRALREEMNADQRLASEAAAAPASQPSTQPVMDLAMIDPPETDLERKTDVLRRRISMTEHSLELTDSAAVSQRLERLIDAGQNQLSQDRQFIQDTLQTLGAQIAATPPITGLSESQRQRALALFQAVLDLAHAQNYYVTALASDAEPAAQALLSAQQELDDLSAALAARQREAAATTQPAGRNEVGGLTAAANQLAETLGNDRTAMKAAAAAFLDKALADADTELKLQAAREAQTKLDVLIQSRDTQGSDLKAMQQNRDDLQQQVNAAVDLKRPTAGQSVRIVEDNSDQKLQYASVAAGGIGAFFALLAWLAVGRKPAEARRHPAETAAG